MSSCCEYEDFEIAEFFQETPRATGRSHEAETHMKILKANDTPARVGQGRTRHEAHDAHTHVRVRTNSQKTERQGCVRGDDMRTRESPEWPKERRGLCRLPGDDVCGPARSRSGIGGRKAAEPVRLCPAPAGKALRGLLVRVC